MWARAVAPSHGRPTSLVQNSCRVPPHSATNFGYSLFEDGTRQTLDEHYSFILLQFVWGRGPDFLVG